MTSFKSPAQFIPGSDPASAWREYKDAFEIYYDAAKLDKEEVKTQRATFLHILGPAGRRIYNTLKITEKDDHRTVQVILQAFDKHYAPQKNLAYLRYVLFITKQAEHQSFDDFLTDLKTKAQDCEFALLTDSIITTLIVTGIRKETLRKSLLSEPDLNLEKATKLSQAEEMATSYTEAMSDLRKINMANPTAANVDAIQHQRLNLQRGRFQSRPPFTHVNQRNRSDQQRFSQQATGRQQTYRNARAFPPPNLTASATRNYRRPRCRSCGNSHDPERCPARNTICHKCSAPGHWATVCRSTNEITESANMQNFLEQDYCGHNDVHVEDLPDQDYCDYNELQPYRQSEFQQHYESSPLSMGPYFNLCLTLTPQSLNQLQVHALPITKLSSLQGREDEVYDELYIFDKPTTFKLDTGSQVNIITQKMYQNLQCRPSLRKPEHTVTAYSGHTVPIVGIVDLPCTSYAATCKYPFYVTTEERTPILGAQASISLGLIQHHRHQLGPPPSRYVHELTPSQTPTSKTNEKDKCTKTATNTIGFTFEELVQQYNAAFDSIGKLPGQYSIKLLPNVNPSISAAHQVPFAYREAVRKELNRMLQYGIIVPVHEPSEWVHPMVVVPKPQRTSDCQSGGNDVDVRICLDPRKLNAAIKRQPYPLPTTQEIFSELSGSRVFTVLDVQSAFWQIPLTEESSRLCTFATPYGRYRYTRLPYGVVTGTEICQQTMRTIYSVAEFPEVHISTDDFLIHSPNATSHKKSIFRVLDRAIEVGLCFGSKKAQFALSKVKFLGNILTPSGVEIDPSKVQAICSMPPPANKAALQSFLGMINYVVRFLPDSNMDTAPLRTLLKKDVVYQWEPEHQKHYENLKKLATTAPVLAFYNPKKSITLSVDASQVGVGAVMLQEGHPVEYASTSFTPTQSRYAQIEKEMLAIVYACEHFNYYVAGMKIKVQTDHKPLLTIVKKPLHLISPRLQRLVMRLFRYQMELIYVPGTQLYIADMLSRAPQVETSINTDTLEGPKAAVYALVSALPPEAQENQKQATASDEVLQKIMKLTRQGWPASHKTLPAEIKPYWQYQDELHTADGLLYRGNCLVIPNSMRKEIMAKLHSTHQGINSCIAKAKLNVFWPRIQEDLTYYIKACAICNNRQRANQSLPMKPYPVPNLPFETVGTDLFKVDSQNLILLVDYFSKFVEAKELTTTNAQAVINFLNPHFARHGAPRRLISDNGPPFNSAAFKNFLSQWAVEHITSSPYYPQSNGMTERTIQTIKNSLIKAKQEGKDLHYVLMEYRATPKNDLPSPAELCMGRRIRTPMTTTTKILEPHYPTTATRQTLQKRQMTMVANQRTMKSLPPLYVGQEVRYLAGHRNWLPATIIAVGPEPRSYQIRTEENQTLRKTRTHLRAIPVQSQIDKCGSQADRSSSLKDILVPQPGFHPLLRNRNMARTVLGRSNRVAQRAPARLVTPEQQRNSGQIMTPTSITDIRHHRKDQMCTINPNQTTSKRQTACSDNISAMPQKSQTIGPPNQQVAFSPRHSLAATDATPQNLSSRSIPQRQNTEVHKVIWPSTSSGRVSIPPIRYGQEPYQTDYTKWKKTAHNKRKDDVE